MHVGDRVTRVQLDPTLLDRIEKREKEIKEMPTMIIKRSALPVLGRGKEGKPSVTVQGKGQISFSPKASLTFGGLSLALVSWDSKTREFMVQTFSKPPKGYTEADMFALGKAKKGGTTFFTGTALLQSTDINIGYDYKTSGNQTFDVKMDEANHAVSFVLPKGSLTAKLKQERKKKVAPVATAATEQAKTAGASAGGVIVMEDE